jgi:hypothetical protein
MKYEVGNPGHGLGQAGGITVTSILVLIMIVIAANINVGSFVSSLVLF